MEGIFYFLQNKPEVDQKAFFFFLIPTLPTK